MPSSPAHQPLLLLSRDLPFDGRDLPLPDSTPADEPPAEQLALPGLEAPERDRTPRRRRAVPTPPTGPSADDPLLAGYFRRLAVQGRAPKGQAAYRYQLRSLLQIACRLAGRPMTCSDLIQDES